MAKHHRSRAQPGMHWDKNQEVSDLWYLAGFFLGIGYFLAIVYLFWSDSKDKYYSLFYLLGIIGAIILAVLFRNTDRRFTNLSVKLIIGNLLIFIAVSIIAIVSSVAIYSGTAGMWL